MRVDTVFAARKIITMNPSRPSATHVAVHEGRVVAVGSYEEICADAGAIEVDRRFADKILLPGFVEGHSHIMEGIVWTMPYVGAGDRRSPEGLLVQGIRDVEG
ncbi:MAG: amidohydrolase, partial [Rhizobiales bacterium]|nr:amidohydrolase [Hyphomicrobiales bacterium]